MTFLESAEVEGLSRLVSEALTPAENVPVSEATTVASLKETVNALLAALKAAGFMKADPEPAADTGDNSGGGSQ